MYFVILLAIMKISEQQGMQCRCKYQKYLPLGMPWGSCPRKKQILFESKHETNKNCKKNSAVNPKEKATVDLFLQTS